MRELVAQARAVDLEPLLLGVALGEEEEMVAFLDERKRLRDVSVALDLLPLDALGKIDHSREIIVVDIPLREVLVALPQTPRERRGAEPMLLEIDRLELIEDGAHLVAGHRGVSEKIEKLIDRLLEVDVVLPERVVAVEDQVLPRGDPPRRGR